MVKIVIDGNIGAGKTTQLGLLESKGWCIYKEPIDKWPLKEFYEDQTRWAFLLHMSILKTLQPIHTTRHVVYERCTWSSRWVFWTLLQDIVHPFEKEIYEYYFDKFVWYPDVYIYISKDPKIAHEHVKKRHQAGDDAVSLEYLEKLDEKYRMLVESMICNKIYIVDGNRPDSEIHEEICKILTENELFVNDSFRKEV